MARDGLSARHTHLILSEMLMLLQVNVHILTYTVGPTILNFSK